MQSYYKYILNTSEYGLPNEYARNFKEFREMEEFTEKNYLIINKHFYYI